MAQVLDLPSQDNNNNGSGNHGNHDNTPMELESDKKVDDAVKDDKEGDSSSSSSEDEKSGGEEQDGELKKVESSFTKVDENSKVPRFLQVTNVR